MKYFLFALLMLYVSKSFSQNVNIQFRSQVTYPFSCSNIWGYVDAQGNEYALVGTDSGLSICDVSNPEAATELFSVPHNQNFWREVKTFANRAYVVNEDGGGVLIVDLSDLPNSIDYHSFTGYDLKTAHTLWIDEYGKLYLFGYNTNDDIPEEQRGMMILDLNADPDNPTLLGTWNGAYIHDGFVRGDTAWLGLILDGKLSVMDVSNPQNAQTFALQTTPSSFCHNAWPTSDNQFVFTTDEKPNSFLTCYDVSSLNNIKETDRIQSNPGSDVVIHNVHLLNNDYAWVSYYRDGVLLYDVSDKENMVQVANYDSSPLAGSGFNGDWGVYPYLPSGNIIISDIENGLFVLTPTYVKAARVQGVITNSVSGQPVNNVLVNIVSTNVNEYSNINGIYKSGIVNGGSYNLHFTRFGYEELTVPVTLINDSIVILDVQMVPIPSYAQSFALLDSATASPLPFAQIFVTDYGLYNYEATADANGIATIDTFYSGTYDIIGGLWGQRTKQFTGYNLNTTSGNVELGLPKGYYDDFYFDFGWSTGNIVPVGQWTREVPNATFLNTVPCNPNQDIVGDFGAKCYVTGNVISASPGDDDVDDGCVLLTSPTFDLSDYTNPLIKYSRWFCNTGGVIEPNDSMKIIISNGLQSKVIDQITVQANETELSKWIDKSIAVKSFISLTNNMKLFVHVCDIAPGNLVEGGFDYLRIQDTVNFDFVDEVMVDNIRISLYPNPANELLTVSIITDQSIESILISDITGRVVKKIFTPTKQQDIDIQELQAAMYMITIKTSQSTIVRKFIKQ